MYRSNYGLVKKTKYNQYSGNLDLTNLDITNIIRKPKGKPGKSYSKMYQIEPRYYEPRYSEFLSRYNEHNPEA